MFILRKLLQILLLPVFFLLMLLKALIVLFEHLSSIVIGAMLFLIGFGIVYCIYSHRYQEIIIFVGIGMVMMAGIFAVSVVEVICDTLMERIMDL